MISSAEIHTNDLIPNGVLVGMNCLGHVVVCLEMHPAYNLIWQAADYTVRENITEWHVSPAHRRRMISELAWRVSDFQCRGNA